MTELREVDEKQQFIVIKRCMYTYLLAYSFFVHVYNNIVVCIWKCDKSTLALTMDSNIY